MIGLLVLLSLSAAFAEGFRLQAGMSLRRLGTGILVALVARQLLDTSILRRRVLVGFLTGSTAATIIGSTQLARPSMTLENLFWGNPTQFGAVERLTLPFGHANVAGAYFAVATVIGAALIPTFRAEGTRLVATVFVTIATLLSAAALSLTLSRSAMAGAAVALLVLVVKRRAEPTQTVRALSPLLVVGGALVFLAAINPAWQLRLEDPDASHWYGVSIDAPLVAVGGETVAITVTNSSNDRWAGSPTEYIEVTVAGDEAPAQRLALSPLAPAASETMLLAIPPGLNEPLFLDVHRPGQGRFLRLTGQTPTQITVGSGSTLNEPDASNVVGPGRGPLPRFELWEAAASLTAQRPLSGVGVGNFRLHYRQVTDSSAPLTSHAHSIVFEPLASWGIPAALLFWGVVLSSLISGLRRANDTISIAATAGLVVLVIVGLTDWPLSSAAGGLGFWLLIGLVSPHSGTTERS